MPLLRPLRALRYGANHLDRLDRLISPATAGEPGDRTQVGDVDENSVRRLVRGDHGPLAGDDEPTFTHAARLLERWKQDGVLVRDPRPTYYTLEQDDGPVGAETMYDQCTWYYGWNSIEEFNFIGPEQLDFHENADGDYEASFKAWHGLLPDGARIWAFVDNDFTSCSPDQGVINRRRDEDTEFFREGTNYPDVLNFPDKYITGGDFISSSPPTVAGGVHENYVVVVDYVRE